MSKGKLYFFKKELELLVYFKFPIFIKYVLIKSINVSFYVTKLLKEHLFFIKKISKGNFKNHIMKKRIS